MPVQAQGVGEPSDVEAFLSVHEQDYFYCALLRARITREECVCRQLRPRRRVSNYRDSVLAFQSPMDAYCRSKDCETGARNRRALGRKFIYALKRRFAEMAARHQRRIRLAWRAKMKHTKLEVWRED